MTNAKPAAKGIAPGHFPGAIVDAGHVEPCPRRIRARARDGSILDTDSAYYVWEHPYYPQYAVPVSGLAPILRNQGRPVASLPGYVVLHFDAAQHWYEEEERVHGHPRNPYVRVDALRSTRPVTVTADGVVLAHTTSPFAVFETGLPPRWYIDRTCVDWSKLTPSRTTSRCAYKGLASGYWSTDTVADVAWSYAAPTAALSLIAGLISFDDLLVTVSI